MTGETQDKLGLKELVAMGVGGMVGGGIFSVLGLSAGLAGHAAPIAFAFGGVIALLTGDSYARLGRAYRSDGGSFTYLERAFPTQTRLAALGGWLLLAGYVGTMGLYAFTFGVYGSALLGDAGGGSPLQHLLQTGVLLAFLGINLYGVRAAGHSEDIIVLLKVILLGLFAVIGLAYVKPDHVLPVFDRGQVNVLMGAALIFVAYEGFELIPNAVNEMEDPQKNLPRAIFLSILITTVIYILVSLVAVGNLTPEEINRYKDYALAVAAEPFLGKAGFVLIGLGALLSTASAINATLFGTARLGRVMAEDEALPRAFLIREKTKDIPWVSLTAITAVTVLFVNMGSLTVISSFASSTFLLIFAGTNLAALKLRREIGGGIVRPLIAAVLCLGSWAVLYGYLWVHDQQSLVWIGLFYAGILIMEFLFSQRGCCLRLPRS